MAGTPYDPNPTVVRLDDGVAAVHDAVLLQEHLHRHALRGHVVLLAVGQNVSSTLRTKSRTNLPNYLVFGMTLYYGVH